MALPFAVELPVMGVPARFEASSPRAMAAVERAYGTWRALAARPDLVGTGRVRIRLVVQSGEEGGESYPTIRARMPDNNRLLLHTTGSMALADAGRLEAHAFVTEALLASEDHFRHGVLDAVTLLLVTRLDRQPVHAAGIARDGVGLLLAGPSGVGKSSLAYAAMQSGYDLLSDDTVYAQLAPTLRVWGLGRPVTLPGASRQFFSEVDGFPVTRRGDQTKSLVPIRVEALPTMPLVGRVGICLLVRSPRPTLERLTSATVVEELKAGLEPGFDRFRDTIALACEQLSRGGSWRLGLAGSPRGSLPYLDRMVNELAANS